MADAPTSYKDPLYASLDASTEQKLGLPAGLLAKIRLHGERSNADQVSEAGARTVYQITPSTRNLVLKRDGIDAYLSPENAAEVAGLVARDGVNWAKRKTQDEGEITRLAAGYYHAGGDQENWGPRTRAYVGRVTTALGATPAQPSSAQGSNTFERAMSAAQPSDAGSIGNVFKAYQSGKMSPDDAKAFEQEVDAGRIMLPRGASLNVPAPADGGGDVAPMAMVQAYSDGKMGAQDAADFESLVKSGHLKLPDGMDPQAILVQPAKEPTLGDKIAAVPGAIAESITGNKRRVDSTEALPDWTDMPELNDVFSKAGWKTGLGTLMAGPEESAKIIQANYPGVQTSKDEAGNILLTSSVDGKQYAIKPGFRVGDIPRAGSAIAAFAPAAGAATLPGLMAGGAATQAAIEGTQAATGGDFSGKDVAIAGLLSGAGPIVGGALKAAGGGVSRVIGTALRGAPETAPLADAAMQAEAQAGKGIAPVVAQDSAPATQAATPAAQTGAPAATISLPEMAQAARTAATGDGAAATQAKQVLAEQAAPDAETIAAAKRLGIEDHLQPDHITTNQTYRELAQAVKSVPGSEARAAELQGLEQVAKRADDLITELGGSKDLSTTGATIKQSLEATQAKLDQQADDLYAKVNREIPKNTAVKAPNTLAFLRSQAAVIDPALMGSAEKRLIRVLESGEDGGVSYATLDRARQQIGQALQKASGPYKDADQGMLKKLYSTLSADQERVAAAQGDNAFYAYKAAQYAVTLRKGVEDDLTGLFGKALDRSLVGDLSGAVTGLSKGDSEKLARLLGSIPKPLREQTVASGLTSAFGRNARTGSLDFNSYYKWFEGVQQNKQAYIALMTNLPPQARQQLQDLYRVSRGIAAASRERITTGRIEAVRQELKGADTLVQRIYQGAARNTGAIAVGTVAGHIPLVGPGIGAAITSALAKGAKTDAIKAADSLIASPEFVALAKSAAAGAKQSAQKQAAARFAKSRQFAQFVKALGNPADMTDRERWVLQSVQAANTQQRH